MNFIAIVNSKGLKMSTVKDSTPKMINQMKELCTKYESMFGETYKVKRFINTRNGWKQV